MGNVAATIDLLVKVVSAIGLMTAAFGGIQFFQAQGDNNAAGKQTGLNLIIAGGGIFAIATTIIASISF